MSLNERIRELQAKVDDFCTRFNTSPLGCGATQVESVAPFTYLSSKQDIKHENRH